MVPRRQPRDPANKVRLELSLERDVWEALVAEAERRDVSRALIVNEALRRYLGVGGKHVGALRAIGKAYRERAGRYRQEDAAARKAS